MRRRTGSSRIRRRSTSDRSGLTEEEVKLMQEKVLVTGGCGFIGANLVAKLLATGKSVKVFDNLSRGYANYLAGMDIELLHGDVRDLETATRACKDIDAVVHLAAYGSVIESIKDPEGNFDINARGTISMLQASVPAGWRGFVFASTG